MPRLMAAVGSRIAPHTAVHGTIFMRYVNQLVEDDTSPHSIYTARSEMLINRIISQNRRADCELSVTE